MKTADMKASDEQKDILRRFAAEQGRTWKSKLNHMWMSGDYGDTSVDDGALQRIRNQFGPSWLVRLRPADLAESV